jgi:hypothetical protein
MKMKIRDAINAFKMKHMRWLHKRGKYFMSMLVSFSV